MDELAEVDAIDQFMLEELKKMKSLSGKLYELIKIYNLRVGGVPTEFISVTPLPTR
ncbi:hypothetical protein Hanom_Chr09g00764901 [Helianthus anomalus]